MDVIFSDVAIIDKYVLLASGINSDDVDLSPSLLCAQIWYLQKPTSMGTTIFNLVSTYNILNDHNIVLPLLIAPCEEDKFVVSAVDAVWLIGSPKIRFDEFNGYNHSSVIRIQESADYIRLRDIKYDINDHRFQAIGYVANEGTD